MQDSQRSLRYKSPVFVWSTDSLRPSQRCTQLLKVDGLLLINQLYTPWNNPRALWTMGFLYLIHQDFQRIRTFHLWFLTLVLHLWSSSFLGSLRWHKPQQSDLQQQVRQDYSLAHLPNLHLKAWLRLNSCTTQRVQLLRVISWTFGVWICFVLIWNFEISL